MATEKCQKGAIIFTCEKCNFKCSKRYNYNKHILTAKHNNQHNQQEKSKKEQKRSKTYNKLLCECGKIYKDRSGLWRHKKNCEQFNANSIVEIVEHDHTTEQPNNNEILSLISQNKELMDLLHEQNKIIKEMVPKIGNNNTTNNTNNFNLNVFLNEECKDAINFSEFINNIQVSFEDLENQAEIGYVNGISKLFIENIQELGIYKRPIHCTDKKRKTLYIKENDIWNKEGSQNTLKKGIREVSRKGFNCLSQEKQENLEEYEDIESDFSQKYLSIKRNMLPNIPQDTTINKVIEKISQNSGIIE